MEKSSDSTKAPSKIDTLELATHIIEAVGLVEVDPASVGADDPLTEAPLHLDSIDILEAVTAVEDKYGVKVKDAEEGAKYFRSLNSISEFISQKTN
ncbi:MAG: acyl carrier protein [Bacteriovoracaceae bacterium]|jgi:acyl carrier protein|nr:acyl carrier protein [Bacteriovoracaceae bacterium]